MKSTRTTVLILAALLVTSFFSPLANAAGEDTAKDGPIEDAFERIADGVRQLGRRLQRLVDGQRPGQRQGTENQWIPDGLRDRVEHPDEITYGGLDFEVPQGATFRKQLSNGIPVYIAEDHELPTFDMSLVVRTGERWNDDQSSVGIAGVTAGQMRDGGTEHYTKAQLDEELSFMAAGISSSAGYNQGEVTLSCLMKDFDRCLELFDEVLRKPAFSAEELQKYKDRAIEGLKDRNNDPRGVTAREFERLMYGDNRLAWRTTKKAVEGYSQTKLQAWWRKFYQPQNFMFVLSGDFDEDEVLAKLEDLYGSWEKGETSFPEHPGVDIEATKSRAGVYHVEMPINQGFVRVGHIGTRRSDPNFYNLQVLNFIFGGGSFTSRIMSRIRSDEGLAYSVYSRYGAEIWEEGIFEINFQTKCESVPYALEILMEEVNRVRDTEVTAKEIDGAKSSYIERFPTTFSGQFQTLSVFADLEYYDRPRDLYDVYRDRIAAVGIGDVQVTAQSYIRPDEFVILVVGPIDLVSNGDGVHGAKLSDFGEIHEIALRDPLADDY
ncbi:MAG: insulinase family protein [Planctomycetes bacterium]|nr:insulinase family protein [Planctomycetota bacterium]